MNDEWMDTWDEWDGWDGWSGWIDAQRSCSSSFGT